MLFNRIKLCLQLTLLFLAGFTSANVHAEYVPPTGYQYHVTLYGSFKYTAFPTPQEAANAFISAANAYYANSQQNISFTLLNVYPYSPTNPLTVGRFPYDWFMDYRFVSSTTNFVYSPVSLDAEAICPAGTMPGIPYGKCWKPEPLTTTTTTTTTTTSSTLRLTVTPSQPIIPSDSEVEKGKVLTFSNLALTLRRGNQPAPNISITLASSNGNNDKISGPNTPTDSAGNASANISTRAQPSTSTVTSSNPNIQTAQPGVISWLPAQYENQFLVTCYVVALESEFTGTQPRTNVCGLPPEKSYYSGFLKEVIMQGTGRALDGTYIKYRSGCYYVDSCARGAGNMCAVAGSTIAVDPSVIPKSRTSTVNVAILGQRIGHDGGAWINGYHIDDFLGEIPKAQCNALGRRHSQITYIHY